MVRRRERDVIDVNKPWTVWLGTRVRAYSIGVVHHADRWLAMQAARERFPEHPRIFVDEMFR